jgi:N-acetylmuramoyl-L-alanine amidase/PKD repeat protein
MGKIFKLIKASAVFLFISIFVLTFIYLPTGGELYADSGQIKVFIDAGHGGKDPGATRFELKEKDANIDIALRLKNKLEANGFLVVMTRTSDVYYSLDDRVNMANSSGADIFLSIHNNAVFSEYAHGTETYWNPNGVEGSSQFASLVQSNILQQTGRANRGVKTANFRVIKYTTMPAALVECAFVSNPTENNLLKTADFRERCANGLLNAIKAFSQGIDKSTGNYSQSSNETSSGFTIKIDEPTNNSKISSNFNISGWSADLKNHPAIELKKVELYKGPEMNESNLLGTLSSFEDDTQGSAGVLSSGWSLPVDIEKLDEGENIIYVYSYDKDNNYSVANVKVNIINDGSVETNLNPTANPGGPYSAVVREELSFDGSGSTDSDGDITEYNWDFGDESTGTGIAPVHTYAEAGEFPATLIVKDDDGAVSSTVQTTVTVEDPTAEEEDLDSTPAEGEIISQFETVTNDTNIIGYIEITTDDLVRIFEVRDSAQAEWARRLAPIYIEYGKLFNMRADIVWAQMIHETGFLEYTGDVAPEQNNFAGIGATGGGVPGNSFATEELGIIAQYAHLAWYYYPGHINEYCSSEYDPRHFGDTHTRYTGDTSLSHLNGRWAPGSTYTNKIIIYSNEIIDGLGTVETPPEQTVTANAGDDSSVEVGEEITFDASVSTLSSDTEETTITYSWDFSGDGSYADAIETATITHIFTEAGIYKVSLKVIAFEDIEATDTVTITVEEPNVAPIADSGGSYTGTAGDEFTLDGSGSTDSDGEITEYTWDFGDESTGTGVAPVHTYAEAGEYTVTLTVKDDDEAVSDVASTATATIEEAVVEEVAEESYPVNTSIITNSTNIIGYTEVTVEQLVKIFEDRNSSKVEWARRIAPIYIQYGKLFNMKTDIAWAQMCHETGFLEYTGDVDPSQNNFVGIGATGGGVPGNSFATEELGIIAHFAHLAWYYYPDHINTYCSMTYDPRHFGSSHYRYTGDTTLNHLNGRWAPGATYTDKIIVFSNQIYGS